LWSWLSMVLLRGWPRVLHIVRGWLLCMLLVSWCLLGRWLMIPVRCWCFVGIGRRLLG